MGRAVVRRAECRDNGDLEKPDCALHVVVKASQLLVRMKERLLFQCAGGGPTSSTASLAFLLLHSVAAVRDSAIVLSVKSGSEVAKLLATAAAAASTSSAAKAKVTRALNAAVLLTHVAMGGSGGRCS